MQPKKILVIEDDSRIHAVIQTIFKINNINADFANSGEKALDMVTQDNYSMILSDVMLPGLDGYDVLEEIKNNEQTKNIPFIFLSAFADDADVHKGLSKGADDYLTKPFTAKTLVNLVKMYIGE